VFELCCYDSDDDAVMTNVRLNNVDGCHSSAVNSGELSAEQIVSRFAENAGLSLVDVFSNYTEYANAIQQSFTSEHRKSLSHSTYSSSFTRICNG